MKKGMKAAKLREREEREKWRKRERGI